MNRIWTIGIALTLVGMLLQHASVPAEAKARSKISSTSPKPSQGQGAKRPKSLYFPELMIGGEKNNHPDFLWSPKSHPHGRD